MTGLQKLLVEFTEREHELTDSVFQAPPTSLEAFMLVAGQVQEIRRMRAIAREIFRQVDEEE